MNAFIMIGNNWVLLVLVLAYTLYVHQREILALVGLWFLLW